jgi:hypothetical protein
LIQSSKEGGLETFQQLHKLRNLKSSLKQLKLASCI